MHSRDRFARVAAATLWIVLGILVVSVVLLTWHPWVPFNGVER